ncbi:MAG: helix-turn-helix domain-containing protein [Eubacterium sp.]|nr:helix-turn-helix domain-containing protein [Eubacterium sp.]
MILVGERIKDLRTSRKFSQKELAQILNVSPAAICNIESNSRQPSIAMLLKLSNTFHVSVDYLLNNQPVSDYVSTKGLSESQIQILNNLIQAFHNENTQ